MVDKDGELLDDADGLLARIGKGKKDAPPEGRKDGEEGKGPAGTPAESPASSGGDFSLLMKKLGMGEKRAAAPASSSPPPDLPAKPQEVPQAPDVVTLDDLLEEEEPPAPEKGAPAKEPAVEIHDEDPRVSHWKKKLKIAPEPALQTPAEQGSDSEEKIISVDQITNLSGLILPKSATFEVEELKLHSRVSAYDGKSIGNLPDEFDEIWKKELS
ncbi:MAG TPA: secretion system protein E, partial [Methanoregula sp.]|nr:secretion system protein E [Methanoregula sp.]